MSDSSLSIKENTGAARKYYLSWSNALDFTRNLALGPLKLIFDAKFIQKPEKLVLHLSPQQFCWFVRGEKINKKLLHYVLLKQDQNLAEDIDASLSHCYKESSIATYALSFIPIYLSTYSVIYANIHLDEQSTYWQEYSLGVPLDQISSIKSGPDAPLFLLGGSIVSSDTDYLDFSFKKVLASIPKKYKDRFELIWHPENTLFPMNIEKFITGDF